MSFYRSLISLPTSKFLSFWWNLGSFLGMVLLMQIFSGLLLTLHYSNMSMEAFNSVDYIMRDVNCGWFLRLVHFNGASLFFFSMYLHIFKAFMFCSYRIKKTWFSGLILLLFSMMVAFLGYVLVWAQMSYWAAVVITSLMSVLPSGSFILLWVWGGFGVGSSTLNLFYTLHFLLPWFLLLLVMFHLNTLHSSGSTSLLYYLGFLSKGFFFPYYVVKDFINIIYMFFFFLFLLLFPYTLGDPEMFIEANNLVSPVHILPEWYFNWAYGILRSIPNKSLGVLALLCSILIALLFCLLNTNLSLMTSFNKILVLLLITTFFLLSWLGQCPAEEPFVSYGFYFSVYYFTLVVILINFNFFNNWLFGL